MLEYSIDSSARFQIAKKWRVEFWTQQSKLDVSILNEMQHWLVT